MGYKYNEKTKNFDPVLESTSPYLQKDNFLKGKETLWIPAMFFYIASIFWLMSYFKLICTDIEFRVQAPSGSGNVCTKCKTIKRGDVYHCSDCGVCNELHDHHCDVVQVCVCGANFKYFILFMYHAANMFFCSMASIAVLNSRYNNIVLKDSNTSLNTVIMVLFGILGAIFVCCPCIFIFQSPLCDDTGEMYDLVKQLRQEYRGRGYSD